MPVGTSTGEVYEDQFDFQVKSPLVSNYLSQSEGVVPKEGQTPPAPVTSPDQMNKSVLDFLTPESLKPMAPEETERRLRAFQEAKPGEKVPELENPAQSSIFAGATDALGMLPVGGAGASSKAMFLGLGGMRRLLGDFAFENTVKRADAFLSKAGPELNRQASTELSMKTGITIGADNLPRYEIPNHRSAILEENMITGPKNTLSPKIGDKVEDILHHPELFKAYPELAKISVYPLAEEFKGKALGVINSMGIQLAPMEQDQLRDVLLHELQHGIQKKEGFAGGGSWMEFAPDLPTRLSMSDEQYNKTIAEAKDKYKKLAGETEARNVVTRRNLTISQRARMLPEDTEDIPRAEQVIRK